MSFEIRRATPEEAPLVLQIMRAAFAEYAGVLNPPSGANHETLADVQKAMCEGGALLAWDGELAVGSARFRPEPDCMYVGRVAVLPEYRGKGVGAALMRAMEDVARKSGRTKIRLNVRMSLAGNLSFYEKLGYTVVEIGPHPKGFEQVATLVKQIGNAHSDT
jgi:ribosomal protein S18 acetylase RimI-like enzyme